MWVIKLDTKEAEYKLIYRLDMCFLNKLINYIYFNNNMSHIGPPFTSIFHFPLNWSNTTLDFSYFKKYKNYKWATYDPSLSIIYCKVMKHVNHFSFTIVTNKFFSSSLSFNVDVKIIFWTTDEAIDIKWWIDGFNFVKL